MLLFIRYLFQKQKNGYLKIKYFQNFRVSSFITIGQVCIEMSLNDCKRFYDT